MHRDAAIAVFLALSVALLGGAWFATARRSGVAFSGDASSSEAEGEAAGGGVLDAVLGVVYQAEGLLMSGKKAMSAAGLASLKTLEGYSPTPYKDAGGQSIGFGHFIKTGEWIGDTSADELLMFDVQSAVDSINSLVRVPLTQAQFDALVSLAYNIGLGAFRGSTLLRLLNAGDYVGAAGQFRVWNRAGGQVNRALVARREVEAALFSGGMA